MKISEKITKRLPHMNLHFLHILGAFLNFM